MSDTNMQYWNRLCKPPPKALKQIKGGRLKGMTDINPQWRMLAMTEVFGPVGVGWIYAIDNIKYEAGTDGQIVCIAFVSVRIANEDMPDGLSHPIPGVGASMYIAKESTGLRTNDEAPKMAITDALSVALKSIGVAADIYMGQMDTKYAIDQAKKSDEPTEADANYDLLVEQVNNFEDHAAARSFVDDANNIAKFQKMLGKDSPQLHKFSQYCSHYLKSLREAA